MMKFPPTWLGKGLHLLRSKSSSSVLKGRVLTRRGVLRNEEDLLCPLCNLEEDDLDHLFVLDVPWVFDKTCGGCIDS